MVRGDKVLIIIMKVLGRTEAFSLSCTTEGTSSGYVARLNGNKFKTSEGNIFKAAYNAPSEFTAAGYHRGK